VTANIAMRLLQHYVDNFRRLPWRSPPGGPRPDPYRVWLSEIMLQQTTVATVIPRFERFIARWPTVSALAAARDEDVLGEWAGLGYYARARNLIACARQVAAEGGFPTARGELRRLPGIGAYTSAAIAAIAFGEKAPAVDTNVQRVVARLFALADPARGEIEMLVEAMMPADAPGDSVQAMMDLGAAICRPLNPRCADCPLRTECAAFASGTPEAFPARKLKRIRPHRYGIAWWIEQDGMIWLVRRPARGLLGGMAALPGTDWSDAKHTAQSAAATVRHVFTHFTLDLDIVAAPAPLGAGWWQPLEQLGGAGLPTLYRRAADLMLAGSARAAA
jgi:A/G-specific adenine glycosylase